MARRRASPLTEQHRIYQGFWLDEFVLDEILPVIRSLLFVLIGPRTLKRRLDHQRILPAKRAARGARPLTDQVRNRTNTAISTTARLASNGSSDQNPNSTDLPE